jgi:hypothetical protein
MIQEKTRGNLTNEETAVLRNTLSNLQMAFVEVSQQTRGRKSAAAPPEPSTPSAESSATSAPAESSDAPVTPPAETESRKKFTKSYGA